MPRKVKMYDGSDSSVWGTAFARHQLAENPELLSIWTRGLMWGFAHVTLAADEATIRIVSTPDDGNGLPELAFEHRFDRRSGR